MFMLLSQTRFTDIRKIALWVSNTFKRISPHNISRVCGTLICNENDTHTVHLRNGGEVMLEVKNTFLNFIFIYKCFKKHVWHQGIFLYGV